MRDIRAQMLFVVLITLAGIAGGLIGYSLVDLQCTGSCAAPQAYGALIGVMIAAFGMGIVGTLILRSMKETRHN